jgi:hypothetical protein
MRVLGAEPLYPFLLNRLGLKSRENVLFLCPANLKNGLLFGSSVHRRLRFLPKL